MKHLDMCTSNILIVQKNGLISGSKDNVTWCSGQLLLQIKGRGTFWRSNERIQTGNRPCLFPLFRDFYAWFPWCGSLLQSIDPFFCPVGRRQEGLLHLEVWDLNGSQFARLDRCLETGNKLHYFFQITQLCILSSVCPFSSLMLKVLT